MPFGTLHGQQLAIAANAAKSVVMIFELLR